MNINNNQDTTPYDRMDDALLRQLLGTDRAPRASDGDEQPGCPTPLPAPSGLNCRGERVSRNENEAVPTMATPGECNKRAYAFGVQGGHLATLYIPVQEFDDLYDEESALQHGTLFRALDLPFVGGKRGRCYDDAKK